ncbi:hypothetical protein BG004_004929, partial [Podila humilis]
MTLQAPIPSATIGIAQVGSTDSTPVSGGILMEPGGDKHLLTIAAAASTIPESKTGSSSGIAPTVTQGGNSNHDVAAGDDKFTLPADMKKPVLGSVPAGLNLPTDRPRSHDGPIVGALFSVPLKDPIILGVGGSVKTRGSMSLSDLVVDVSGEPDTSELFARVKHSLESSGDLPIPFSQASFFAYAKGLPRPLSDDVPMNCFLELQYVQGSDSIDLNIRYSIDLYSQKTIERYGGYLSAVLVSMVANRTQPVATFNILSIAEKKTLLEKWNDTAAEYPLDRCIHHLFEDQVEKAPGAIAIIHGEKKLTYLELNSLANCLARKISEAGVGPGDHVALLFEWCIELVVAELAVLKAGAAYVPIDTTAPHDRQSFIVLDTRSKLLVTKADTHVPDQVQAPIFRYSADMNIAAEHES